MPDLATWLVEHHGVASPSNLSDCRAGGKLALKNTAGIGTRTPMCAGKR